MIWSAAQHSNTVRYFDTDGYVDLLSNVSH